ncbi:hypothetical protein HMPREF1551_01646 [Capnocytophaga sp. oral taxon 863 str. F0517]|nr:hypothetical protein HMPREF1551_01646 [Capnocytophaga sp. oral taxon 863 str. F0517]
MYKFLLLSPLFLDFTTSIVVSLFHYSFFICYLFLKKRRKK